MVFEARNSSYNKKNHLCYINQIVIEYLLIITPKKDFANFHSSFPLLHQILNYCRRHLIRLPSMKYLFPHHKKCIPAFIYILPHIKTFIIPPVATVSLMTRSRIFVSLFPPLHLYTSLAKMS